MKMILAAMAAFLALTGAAAAQTNWIQQPLEGGCTIGVVSPSDQPSTWDGVCVPGEPISGPGNFSISFAPSGRRVVMTATFVDGVPDGDAVISVFSIATNDKIEEHRMTFVRGCMAGREDCTPLPPR